MRNEEGGGESQKGPPGAPLPLLPTSHWRACSGLAVEAFHNVSPLDFPQGGVKGVHRGAVLAGPVGQQGTDRVFLLGEGVYEIFLVAQFPCQMAPGLLGGTVQQLLHLLALVGWQTGVEIPISFKTWSGRDGVGVRRRRRLERECWWLLPGSRTSF